MSTTAETIRLQPAKLSGTVKAIPSKSDAHRKLICAALADGETRLTLGTDAPGQDILATIACLRALGADLREETPGTWLITPIPAQPPSDPILDCRESGSTLRFLLPVAGMLANRGVNAAFIGSGRLPERPLEPLIRALKERGLQFSAEKLPFRLSGTLTSGRFTLPGDISSQFISGLLFALPLLAGSSQIELTSPLESAAYADMTIAALSAFGIQIEKSADGFNCLGSQRLTPPDHLNTEGDWSSAAFFLAAGALGAEVSVSGLSLTSLQPDRAVVEHLKQFGAAVKTAPDLVSFAPQPLHGIKIDASEAPDLVPILAITACAAQGETLIYNAARLRIKESDRLAAMQNCIRALGGSCELTEDGMRIYGHGSLTGGTVDSVNDHRIAMAAAIASIICTKPVFIHGFRAVEKSYPSFFSDFNALGGNAHV
mgnify:CR=1 FL=1